MILQSAIGTLKMHSTQPLPVGSTVQLQVEVTTRPAPTAQTPTTTLSSPMEQVTTMAQHWSALDETMHVAAQDPAIARDLAAALPTLGPKLTSGLLFFIAAVKSGELKQWIGNKAVSALEAKMPDLAARLKQDMGQLQQLLLDSPLQQWNSVMVPMLHGGQLEHARLFFRHDQESQASDGAKKPPGKEQRFIVEVDLSHMGSLQFDGFVRPGEKAKQFDLMVRSNAALPPELSEQIRTTFQNAMETTGMKGYLGFQHGQQHFVRPMAGEPQAGGNTGSQPILA